MANAPNEAICVFWAIASVLCRDFFATVHAVLSKEGVLMLHCPTVLIKKTHATDNPPTVKKLVLAP